MCFLGSHISIISVRLYIPVYKNVSILIIKSNKLISSRRQIQICVQNYITYRYIYISHFVIVQFIAYCFEIVFAYDMRIMYSHIGSIYYS